MFLHIPGRVPCTSASATPSSRPPQRMGWPATVLLACWLGACGTAPVTAPPQPPAAAGPEPGPPREAGAGPAPAPRPASGSAAPSPGPAGDGAPEALAQTLPESLGPPFSTRTAHFEPVPFSALPGWGHDRVREGLQAFTQSCAALARRAVWQDLCPRAQRLDARDDAALRRFFESHFHAYAVRDTDRSDQGVITGYYEPLLNGSRQRSARFVYPVHGVPADLLFLDSRQVRDGQQVWLRLDGRQLVPAAQGSAGAQPYLLNMGGMKAGVRDRRYRVRIEQQGGQAQVVPYWSRQQIERRGLDAQVLAWVDNAFALYSMQIQGSGKIRLAESGEIVRVAYGEQNGHPFLPQASQGDAAAVGTAVKTRGLYAGSAVAGSSTPSAPSAQAAPASQPLADDEVQRIIAALGGTAAPSAAPPRPVAQPQSQPAPAAPAPAPRPPAGNTSQDPEVAAMIAALLGQAPPMAIASAPPSTPTAATPTAGAGAQGGGTPGAATGIPDPSYVFFRRIPDGPHGPLGALGVPLTDGRSIAVDPRTTPLGFPVFLSTAHAGEGPIQRLVFAQDTGGAIRGTIRADYYWGSGAEAGRLAARMKAPGRMWLLVPKGLEVSALSAVRTRSGRGPAGPLPECVWADDEFCAEEW